MTPRPLAALCAASLLLLAGLRAQDPPLLADGSQAPDFVSVDAAGKEVRLADFAGKIVVLDFWATWCGPCLRSLPHVQELAKAHRDHGVVVLAVCTGDTRARFTDWVQKNAATYPDLVFACDPHDRGSDTFDQRASAKLYHVSGLPTKFVLGKDGKVAMGIVGHEKEDTRLEAGLARAGIPVDAAAAKAGEALAKKLAAAAAAEAAEQAAHPMPAFFPQLIGYFSGDPLPDFTMLGADGKEFALSSLRGQPLIVIAAPADGLPRSAVREVAARWSPYGVRTLAMLVHTARADFTAFAQKHPADAGYAIGGDPAGTYQPAGDQPDPDAQLAFHQRTLLGKLFGSGMYPAMPFCFVVDQDGKLVGSFGLGPQRHEGVANLLLHAGVVLQPKDQPQQVAGKDAFVKPPPRPTEAPVALLADGKVAPDFVANDLDGQPVRLADFTGKVVVLDFWATWCGPCKAALPHVQELAAKYKDQGVVVLASCTSDGRAAFEKFVRQNQGDYPDLRFVHDPLERKPERASRALYGVSGIPHQFVIGRDGKVAAQVDGYSLGEVLLDAALAKAGIRVDAAVLEQAKQDQQKREAQRRQPRGDSVPAVPMVPVGGKSIPATPMGPAGGKVVPAEPVRR